MATSSSDSLLWGWETFFEQLGHFFDSTVRNLSSTSESYAAYVVERFEVCIITLNAIKLHLYHSTDVTLQRYRDQVDEILSICRSLSVTWERNLDRISNSTNETNTAHPPLLRSSRGRPRFDITREQLLYLASMSFTWTDIAIMLGVSRMTIYRRRVQYSLVEDPRIVPTDVQLRMAIREIQAGQPEVGEVMIMGNIRSMGYKVTRERIRQEIRNSDPLHSALRWRGGLTSRRPYSVPGPNSLWHIGK